MRSGRYTVFWRSLAAGLLLGSVMVASVLFSRGSGHSSRKTHTTSVAVLRSSSKPMHARGCTDTWVGSTQTDWTIAGNWSAGRIPTPADRVCVPDGAVVWLHDKA